MCLKALICVYPCDHVCMCLLIGVYVCMCVHVPEHRNGDDMINLENGFYHSILLRQALTRFCLATDSRLTDFEPPGNPLSSGFSRRWNYRRVPPHLSFSHGVLRLKSSCWACTAVLPSAQQPPFSVTTLILTCF